MPKQHRWMICSRDWNRPAFCCASIPI
ncbi:MAG: hypothetical protein AB8B93_16980 [Pseudomonadales bacterium]